jgi:hypothetical protein
MNGNRNPVLNTEYPAPNEQELTEKIGELLRGLVEQRFLQGMTYRSLNTKSHAAVRAEFVVDPSLPEKFRVGIFRETRKYPAWIRYSSTLPDPLPDKDRDLRGMAIKLIGVDGEKLLEWDRHGDTHDLIFITPDTFFTRTPQDLGPAIAAANTQSQAKWDGKCWTDPTWGACNAAPEQSQSPVPAKTPVRK